MPESLRKLYPLFFLTLVVLVAVTLLSFTNSITSPIVERRLQEQVVAQMGEIFPAIVEFEYNEEIDIYTLFADEAKTQKLGYAFMASGTGYSGDINILVGLEDAETVKGISILSQTESPGIGSRITTDEKFLNQFIGLPLSGASLTQDGGQVDGLTGATISSRAVVDIVRQTAMDKVAQLEGAE